MGDVRMLCEYRIAVNEEALDWGRNVDWGYMGRAGSGGWVRRQSELQ